MAVTGLLLLCFLIMFFQDWKYRRIHVLLPILVFGISLFSVSNKTEVCSIVGNIIFFLVVLGVLILYMSLKTKSFKNPLTHYFGLGDILFYITITPLFLLKQYAVYFIVSMIFAVIMQLITQKLSSHETVPLAGFSSLLLFFALCADKLAIVNYKFTIV